MLWIFFTYRTQHMILAFSLQVWNYATSSLWLHGWPVMMLAIRHACVVVDAVLTQPSLLMWCCRSDSSFNFFLFFFIFFFQFCYSILQCLGIDGWGTVWVCILSWQYCIKISFTFLRILYIFSTVYTVSQKKNCANLSFVPCLSNFNKFQYN